MGLVWLFAGLITYFLAQRFYVWQKPLRLPWYAWLVTILAYGSVWLAVAIALTLKDQVADWGTKPMLVLTLGALLLAVIFAAIARVLIGSKQKKGKAVAA